MKPSGHATKPNRSADILAVRVFGTFESQERCGHMVLESTLNPQTRMSDENVSLFAANPCRTEAFLQMLKRVLAGDEFRAGFQHDDRFPLEE